MAVEILRSNVFSLNFDATKTPQMFISAKTDLLLNVKLDHPPNLVFKELVCYSYFHYCLIWHLY